MLPHPNDQQLEFVKETPGGSFELSCTGCEFNGNVVSCQSCTKFDGTQGGPTSTVIQNGQQANNCNGAAHDHTRRSAVCARRAAECSCVRGHGRCNTTQIALTLCCKCAGILTTSPTCT